MAGPQDGIIYMKGIDLFTQQLTQFDSLEDFFTSMPYRYLQKVHGYLTLDEKAKSGLLKVNKTKSGKFIVSESCYYDYPVEGKLVGYIYPSMSGDAFTKSVKANNNALTLSKFGLNLSYLEIDNDVCARLITGEYKEHTPEEDLIKIKKSHNLAHTQKISRANTNETYQVLTMREDEEYYLSNGYKIPKFFKKLAKSNRDNVVETYGGNPWILEATNNDIAIQKMTSGDSINRHSDTLPNGTDRHILYTIHWLTHSSFMGRELIIGKRTDNDLKNFIESSVLEQNNNTGYCSIPDYFEDTWLLCRHSKPQEKIMDILFELAY